MLIDSHCHLDFPQFNGQIKQVVKRAKAAGIGKIVTICTRLDRFSEVESITTQCPEIFMAAGVHPHEAGEVGLKDKNSLLVLCDRPKMVGVGETGLDFFYERSPKLEQEESFRNHIHVCRQTQLPLIVHTREAEADTIRILQDEALAGSFPGVIHCFTGTATLRDAALELGFFISISGIATFNKSQQLRETILGIPLDRILVETDAPYLAPTPHRGKTNEPAYVAHTAEAIAQLLSVEKTFFEDQTTDNFHRLFTKVPR